jgi:hypothetical protein
LAWAQWTEARGAFGFRSLALFIEANLSLACFRDLVSALGCDGAFSRSIELAT